MNDPTPQAQRLLEAQARILQAVQRSKYRKADPVPATSSRKTPDRGPPQPQRRAAPKVGRNAPCPCGSGEKRKRCHP